MGKISYRENLTHTKMAYTINDLVTIVTPDDTLFGFKSILPERFETLNLYFTDHPTARQVILNTPTRGVQDLFTYVDNGTVPVTVDGWLDLLAAADFLDLVTAYREPLLDQATEAFYQLYEPTIGEDVIYYSGPMGAKNLTLRDAFQEYAFLRDNAQ